MVYVLLKWARLGYTPQSTGATGIRFKENHIAINLMQRGAVPIRASATCDRETAIVFWLANTPFHS
ncbi:hypothetical protein RU08_08315 [Pseudomonas fulva]|uniref:Uncharacterized protein n=1 Tax=Pseudomonas fulva TaxID=47880 RepID=A0A0D0K016_9PSED|nr:hypothetical protein RU08_08315 [Pseudomonas fulva]